MSTSKKETISKQKVKYEQAKQTDNYNDEPIPIDEEEEYDNSAPFPIPMNSTTLDRTSLFESGLNQTKKDHWKAAKDKTDNSANMNRTNSSNSHEITWPNIYKAIKSTPSHAMRFLGVNRDNDVNRTLNSGASTSPTSNGRTTRLSGANQVDKTVPLTTNNTLTNWNERTFKVLNNNMIFGGKIKNKAFESYRDNLDEDCVNKTSLFYYNKITGEKHVDAGPPISIADLTVNGLKKVLQKSKKPGNDAAKSTPEKDFEMPVLKSHPDFHGEDMPDNRAYRPENDDKQHTEDEEENIPGPCDAFTHAFGTKRIFGIGFCGRLCDNTLDPDKKNEFQELIASVKQYRPYFTYWVTFVQILICFISIFAYGLAPFGLSYQTKRGLATNIQLEKELISYPIKQNFWIGPAFMDLIHLGAKYAPCMRNDTNIFKAIEIDRLREKESACCVRNDRGGCVQATQSKCSPLVSKWHKWNGTNYKAGVQDIQRTSGSVCGLDPRFCEDIDSYKWPDDITQWPICEKPNSVFNSSQTENQHMYCEIIGRPCCIGIQGECTITTREHCDIMKGYFHEQAHLCSQVDCMQDICGMIDFLNTKNPDQVYRLFTSIFIHAGIFQLVITIIFQIFILRDVEKLAGSLRVAIIYITSGIIGNLGSSIFLPYQAEVGPLGSQFGIIACLFVETFHAWELYSHPWIVCLKLLACLFVLIIIGFLPMIDNFANVFGFISGLLLGSILFPNIDYKGRCRRPITIAICGSITILTVATLIILFYVRPIEKCDWCKFLSCPFGKQYCLDMDFNITRITK